MCIAVFQGINSLYLCVCVCVCVNFLTLTDLQSNTILAAHSAMSTDIRFCFDVIKRVCTTGRSFVQRSPTECVCVCVFECSQTQLLLWIPTMNR